MAKCIICDSEMCKIQECNPFPIRKVGKCCQLCDHLLVIPARMAMARLKVSPQILRLITQLSQEENAKLKLEIIEGEKQ